MLRNICCVPINQLDLYSINDLEKDMANHLCGPFYVQDVTSMV